MLLEALSCTPASPPTVDGWCCCGCCAPCRAPPMAWWWREGENSRGGGGGGGGGIQGRALGEGGRSEGNRIARLKETGEARREAWRISCIKVGRILLERGRRDQRAGLAQLALNGSWLNPHCIPTTNGSSCHAPASATLTVAGFLSLTVMP